MLSAEANLDECNNGNHQIQGFWSLPITTELQTQGVEELMLCCHNVLFWWQLPKVLQCTVVGATTLGDAGVLVDVEPSNMASKPPARRLPAEKSPQWVACLKVSQWL